MRVVTWTSGDLQWIRVYDYTLDDIREFKQLGWRLYGTYRMYCSLWKYVD